MELNVTVFSLFNEKRFKDLEKEIYRSFTKEIKCLDDLDTVGRLEGLIKRFIIKYRLREVDLIFCDISQAFCRHPQVLLIQMFKKMMFLNHFER